MVQLTRKAPLLVALYVLTSPATAYVECAWVLWMNDTSLFYRTPAELRGEVRRGL